MCLETSQWSQKPARFKCRYAWVLGMGCYMRLLMHMYLHSIILSTLHTSPKHLTSTSPKHLTSTSPKHLDQLVKLTEVLLVSLRQEHLSDVCPVGRQHILLDATHLTTVVMDK